MAIIRGVLLDTDGTLIDSNDAHTQAWLVAFEENGYHLKYEQVRRAVGMGGDHLIPDLIHEDNNSAVGKRVSERRGDVFKERFLPHLQPFAGVRALLERMRAEGQRLVVASSSEPDELEAMLKRTGADDLIEHQTSSKDAEHSKPDPDIIGAALERIGLPAEQVVLLGDTPYDVAAGKRAGIGVIALRSGGWEDADFRDADAIYDDAADLLAHFDESLLAQ